LVIHKIQDPFGSLLLSPKKGTTDVRKILISSYEDYLNQSSNVLMEIKNYLYEDPFSVFLKSSSQLMLRKFISSQLDKSMDTNLI